MVSGVESIKRDRTISEVQDLAAAMLKKPVLSAERIGKGSNSRVFKLVCNDSKAYVAKFYFCHPADPRDRLSTEYTSLSFLQANGITDVPRPMAINTDESCAIYEYIEGTKIASREVNTSDIASAVSFLSKLKELKGNPESQTLPPASEACFSIPAIVNNIAERLNRLYKVALEGDNGDFKSFLISGIKPHLNILREWVHRRALQTHVLYEKEIPVEHRTLSPSDFGFHNAIRDKEGRLVFLDFEYFGWDDPAKMICDFLLHPAMNLSEEMKKLFVQETAKLFKENELLAKRVELAYPLFGIKWCLIFLNEFIPDEFSRRTFAVGDLDKKAIQEEQLLKARNLYRRIKETYQNFSYK